MGEPEIQNHGIVIGGQANVTGPIAAGFQAKAIQHQTDLATARQSVMRDVDAMIDLVSRFRGVLSDGEQAQVAASVVRAELAQPDPDRDRVNAALARLAAGATSVSALAVAVEKVKQAVVSLWSF